MPFALSPYAEGDMTLALKLPLDMEVNSFLVAFYHKEQVSLLGEAPVKDTCVM